MPPATEDQSPQLSFAIRGTWAVVPCFGITLYTGEQLSRHGDAVLQAFERFSQLVPPQELRFYATETMDKRKPVGPRTLSLLANWLRPDGPAREYVALDLTCGGDWWESSDRNFSVFGQERSSPTLALGDAHWVRMTFPLGWMGDRLDALEQQANALFASMPFVSGSAGPMLELCPYYRMQSQGFAWPTVMRYRGFDFCDPMADGAAVRDDGLRNVSWLTFLGSRLAQQLGGPAALAQRLGQAAQLSELPTGVCIKAGARPGLGDWMAQDRLDAYAAVFQACEPAIDRMAQRYSPMILRGDAKDKTVALLRRLAYEDA